MSSSYDDMMGAVQNVSDHPTNMELHSMPKSSPPDGTKLAGDVVPLPVQPSSTATRQPNAILQIDTPKVTSYSTFLSKKFPMKDK